MNILDINKNNFKRIIKKVDELKSIIIEAVEIELDTLSQHAILSEKKTKEGDIMSKPNRLPTAQWAISLDIYCPNCKSYVDLTKAEDFWDGKPNDLSFLNMKDNNVLCPECLESFQCDFEY